MPDQTVDYTMTPSGKVVSITGQGSTSTYTWDGLGRLAGVDDTAAGTFGFAYDNATGDLATMSRPNSVSDHFSFDADGRLTARVAKNPAGTILDEADYTYNTAGLRATLTDLAGVHDYSYDPDGHLTGVDNPDGGLPDEAYTYDALGNLTTWPGNPATQVKHNTADQLTQDATNTYTYDNEGNQVTKRNRTTGDTTTYTWNAAHQLTKITNPDGSSVAYGYGPLGRRLTATDSVTGKKVFVWAGANLRATLDTTGALVNRNITTPDLNGTLAVTTPQGTDYPLKDGLGSTTATTDSTGTVTSTTSYSAYGQPTTTGNNNGVNTVAGYTGHQTDPTSLVYARARYYNPQTGTFQTQDPVSNMNLYMYASGDPINYTDPTGADIIGEAILDGAAKGAVLGAGLGVFTCRGATNYARCLALSAGSGAVAGGIGGGLMPNGVQAALNMPLAPAAACFFGGLASVLLGEGASYVVMGEPSDSKGVLVDFASGCIEGLGGGLGPGAEPAPAG